MAPSVATCRPPSPSLDGSNAVGGPGGQDLELSARLQDQLCKEQHGPHSVGWEQGLALHVCRAVPWSTARVRTRAAEWVPGPLLTPPARMEGVRRGPSGRGPNRLSGLRQVIERTQRWERGGGWAAWDTHQDLPKLQERKLQRPCGGITAEEHRVAKADVMAALEECMDPQHVRSRDQGHFGRQKQGPSWTAKKRAKSCPGENALRLSLSLGRVLHPLL